jgi:hypothetical protein
MLTLDRRMAVDANAADHLVADLDQVAGVEERAAAKEGVPNSLQLGMQGAALIEEVRLGVEAVGSVHATVSLRQSNELCRGPASSRRVTGGYDAQSQGKWQSATAAARQQDEAGRHHSLDSRARFVGRQAFASSACLLKE